MSSIQPSTNIMPTTHWSLIARAGAAASPEQSLALDSLLRQYSPALRAYLVEIKRIDSHRAEDLIQEFITAKFLEEGLAKKADPMRGRFRALLITSLNRFIISEARRDSAQKRSPGSGALLCDDCLENAADNDTSPNHAFEVAWARQLLRTTLKQMETECRASKQERVWEVFEKRLLGPILEGNDAPAYEDSVRW